MRSRSAHVNSDLATAFCPIVRTTRRDRGAEMTDVVNKHLLVFGHSHLNAMRRAYRRFYGNGEDPSAPPPFAVTFVQLHQDVFQPNILKANGNRKLNDAIKQRFNKLTKRGRPDVIVSCA